MAIKTEKLVNLLNHDLELEYSAAIQYINHAAVMTGAAYGDIIKELKVLAYRGDILAPLHNVRFPDRPQPA